MKNDNESLKKIACAEERGKDNLQMYINMSNFFNTEEDEVYH